jgi:hypothetical protein
MAHFACPVFEGLIDTRGEKSDRDRSFGKESNRELQQADFNCRLRTAIHREDLATFVKFGNK